jgi:hypothetical protein
VLDKPDTGLISTDSIDKLNSALIGRPKLDVSSLNRSNLKLSDRVVLLMRRKNVVISENNK